MKLKTEVEESRAARESEKETKRLRRRKPENGGEERVSGGLFCL